MKKGNDQRPLTPEEISAARSNAPALPSASDSTLLPPTRAERARMGPSLEELQADATARAAVLDEEDRKRYGPAGANWFNAAHAAVTPAGAALPGNARAAAGLAVVNPKLWHADVKPIPGRIDKAGWLRAVRLLPKQPELTRATVIGVANSLAWFVGREVAGVAKVSYETIAKAAFRCPETVRKVIRALEANGLLDTFNVLQRHDGQVRRGANVYGLRGFIAAIKDVVDATTSAVTGAFDRMGEQLRRYAGAWGLKARKWGLNATPQAFPAPS